MCCKLMSRGDLSIIITSFKQFGFSGRAYERRAPDCHHSEKDVSWLRGLLISCLFPLE